MLSFQIEEIVNNYKSSLDALAHVLLIDNLYRQDDQIVRLLKLSYTEDEYLKLLPVIFYSSTKPYKSFAAHGSIAEDLLDPNFLNKLNQHR